MQNVYPVIFIVYIVNLNIEPIDRAAQRNSEAFRSYPTYPQFEA